MEEVTQAVVIEALESATASFSRHLEIGVAYLFGSYARGEPREGSDIDVGVVYRQRNVPRATHERVATELAVEVARHTGVAEVDVVDLEAQGPIFCHRVLCEGRRLYVGDSVRRIDFESDTLVRAFDFRPTYDMATGGKRAALRRWLRRRYDIGTDPDEARHAEGEPGETRTDPPGVV